MSGRSRCYWGIRRSILPPGISGSPGSIWRRSAARSTSCPVGTRPSLHRSNAMPPHTTDCPDAAARPAQHPTVGVADIFRLYGEAYRRADPVPPAHQRVMRDLDACRTAQLGGHAEHCPTCGFERYAYNSCRHRHCPKCQTFTKVQWVEDRKTELLPVPYFPWCLPCLTTSIRSSSRTSDRC